MGKEQGFRLVVNVTDPATDFTKNPVHGLQLVGIHAGAGIEMITVDKEGATFFSKSDKTVNLAITGSTPYGVSQGDEPVSPLLYGLGIESGKATSGIEVVAPEKTPVCADLRNPRVGSYIVCDHGFSAPEFAQLEVMYLEVSKGVPSTMPENCVAVKLLPECAPLVLKDATYDHSNIVDTTCHAGKVAEIDWSKQEYC
ncbi:hypothetical protein K4F52_008557 [Lecanicillium sp. MT-2017a]|nr:hypothetical protein K4F52_008557 [Lecanicillium sp. MT-2017a]